MSKKDQQARIIRGDLYALRLDVAKALARTGPLTWNDQRTGEQEAKLAVFGDVVLARKDTPTSYHLSVTVDDAAQGVTLVTRGEDRQAYTVSFNSYWDIRFQNIDIIKFLPMRKANDLPNATSQLRCGHFAMTEKRQAIFDQ